MAVASTGSDQARRRLTPEGSRQHLRARGAALVATFTPARALESGAGPTRGDGRPDPRHGRPRSSSTASAPRTAAPSSCFARASDRRGGDRRHFLHERPGAIGDRRSFSGRAAPPRGRTCAAGSKSPISMEAPRFSALSARGTAPVRRRFPARPEEPHRSPSPHLLPRVFRGRLLSPHLLPRVSRGRLLVAAPPTARVPGAAPSTSQAARSERLQVVARLTRRAQPGA
jgi:hypothetical protein